MPKSTKWSNECSECIKFLTKVRQMNINIDEISHDKLLELNIILDKGTSYCDTCILSTSDQIMKERIMINLSFVEDLKRSIENKILSSREKSSTKYSSKKPNPIELEPYCQNCQRLSDWYGQSLSSKDRNDLYGRLFKQGLLDSSACQSCYDKCMERDYPEAKCNKYLETKIKTLGVWNEQRIKNN